MPHVKTRAPVQYEEKQFRWSDCVNYIVTSITATVNTVQFPNPQIAYERTWIPQTDSQQKTLTSADANHLNSLHFIILQFKY